MTTVSYAQNHEDVLLDRVFARGKPGFYVDIGANDPIANSVTKHFYDLGWRGINVEPCQGPFEALQAARSRDVNLNVGISDVAGELTFYEFPPELSGISTFSAAEAARHNGRGQPSVERTVPTMTLAEVCERHVDTTIDFMSVDVEGHEREVLSGNDWKRFRPRVVLVEATEPTTTIPTHDRWEPILLEADYRFAAFDGLNRYYVRSEDADLAPALAVPVNVTDDFIPHRYEKILHDSRWTADVLARQIAATRAVNATLRAEAFPLEQEVWMMRDKYQRLERALASARAQCDEVRAATEAARERADQLAAELTGLRGGDSANGVVGAGAAALGLARKLTAVSSRHPKASASAKKVLRLGLQAKRTLTGGDR